jgi:hypothetical protein
VLSRRALLHAGAVWAAGVTLAACGSLPQEGLTNAEAIQPVAQPVLPSPVPDPQADAVEEQTLAQFLSLSAVLTGFTDLDPILGRVYLQSLEQSDQFEVSVEDVIQADGDSTTLEELEAAGLFDDPATQTLADKIIEMWYTGVYDTAEGEQKVATYVDALVWRSLTFTKPLTICGTYGFWEQPPEAPLA